MTFLRMEFPFQCSKFAFELTDFKIFFFHVNKPFFWFIRSSLKFDLFSFHFLGYIFDLFSFHSLGYISFSRFNGVSTVIF